MRSRTSARTPTSITIPTSLSLTSGTFQLTAIVKDNTGATMAGTAPDAWHTSSPSVVTVSSTGLVTFVAVGTSNVTASLTTVGGTITSNTCVVTGSAGVNYVRSDFESGSYSPEFSNPYVSSGERWTIVNDPTGGGHGKVAQVQYFTNGVTQFDDNQALINVPYIRRNAGESIWFQGDLHIPTGTNMSDSFCQRKLLYWGWNGTQPQPYAMVLDSFGHQISIATRVNSTGNSIQYYVDEGVFSLNAGIWYRVKAHVQPNTDITAADGIVQIYMDNVKIFEKLDIQWTNPPEWAGHTVSEYYWDSWGWGDQVSAATAVNELRYWDNVSFASTEDAL